MPIRYSSVVGGSGSSGFNLDIGSSGNTTFVFSEAQPAGGYSITSQLTDATIEFYAIAQDGSLVGYTNTKALTASQDFTKMVVYGATTNDLITFEFKETTSPTSSGQETSGVPPFLSSATPSSLPNADDTTTVTGGNFASDVEIVFTGQDDVDRAAKSIVRSDSTSLIVERPDDFPVAQEPYSMSATNPGTPASLIAGTLTDYFDAGGVVSWITDSVLTTGFTETSYTQNLQATDADGEAVVYSLVSGSLPSGLSLNSSTGVISGTIASNALTQTFSIAATDLGNNVSTKEFTIPIKTSFSVDYLIVGGGGGGGSSPAIGNQSAGGGGAGGYRTSAGTSGGGALAESQILLATDTEYAITVGAGGTGARRSGAGNELGNNGTGSAFSTIISLGGGGGNSFANGSAGGSGGGAGPETTRLGGAGESGQGYPGANGNGYNVQGGGGGGAFEAGDTDGSGAGGDGIVSPITNIAYAGGGGGSYSGSTSAGVGGGGGGGNGASSGNGGESGDANTGGGGGGAQGYTGGNGGSGVVVIKYPNTVTLIPNPGLVYTTSVGAEFSITEFISGDDTITFASTSDAVFLEYLVVAGGGPGGHHDNSIYGQGGGGAGGYRSNVPGESSGGGATAEPPYPLVRDSEYTVTVGAGGAVSAANTSNGNNSTLATIVSIGGGGGSGNSSGGNDGGSGGGGRYQNIVGGTGEPGQGFDGATHSGSSGYGVGGGGAGEAGANYVDTAGVGGDGLASSITGSAVIRAGGGGGGDKGSPGGGGLGGSGGGGKGADDILLTVAEAGEVNTGGGGGGASAADRVAGAGGSGIVIIKYADTETLTIGPGLVSSTDSSSVPGYKITTFTSGTDTITFS